jgi:hypothetical protein
MESSIKLTIEPLIDREVFTDFVVELQQKGQMIYLSISLKSGSDG